MGSQEDNRGVNGSAAQTREAGSNCQNVIPFRRDETTAGLRNVANKTFAKITDTFECYFLLLRSQNILHTQQADCRKQRESDPSRSFDT
jgi:hypothetical protein